MAYDTVYIKNILKLYRYYKNNNIPIQQIYDIYDPVKSTLYKWISKYSNSNVISLHDSIKFNFIKSKLMKCNNKKITNEIKQFIINKINEHPQILSKTINEMVNKNYNIKFSINHISRIIRDLNYSYKKVQVESTKTTTNKFNEQRDILITQIKESSDDDIICIDEYHICFIDKPNYGRSLINTKCIVHEKPSNKRHSYSVIEAINNKGRVATCLVNGSIDGDIFNNFIMNHVLPHCTSKTKLLMDNASIHRCDKFKTYLLINDITIDKIIYNVPYSPKYNPIEYHINTTKKTIKQQNIQQLLFF